MHVITTEVLVDEVIRRESLCNTAVVLLKHDRIPRRAHMVVSCQESPPCRSDCYPRTRPRLVRTVCSLPTRIRGRRRGCSVCDRFPQQEWITTSLRVWNFLNRPTRAARSTYTIAFSFQPCALPRWASF